MALMHRIEFKETPKGSKEVWALFDGKKKDALHSARRLLVSLREDSYFRFPAVFLDGKRIQWNGDSDGESRKKKEVESNGKARFDASFRGGPLDNRTFRLKEVPSVIVYRDCEYIRQEGENPYVYVCGNRCEFSGV